ncbi:MAG: leucyl/phenylalanyl-tRNA--protein transferase [Gammaproteobacteria bacterium]|nr:leucyl/phenylalanyl-tRNA--protein transferase [Gammaproteobacteria bacterium]
MNPRERAVLNLDDSPSYFCIATQTWSPTLPSAELALEEPNGLVAMGGSLAPAALLAAYRHGIFPWYCAGQPTLWWSPNPRAVLRPEEFHVSRSLRRCLRRPWRITLDVDFAQVLQACAVPRSHEAGTWLSAEMQAAYLELHRAGHAHSLECWLDDHLVGGIYGVAIGQLFFGESMFSRINNGSKVALYALCRRLVAWGYHLLDCQVPNPHLVSLGMTLLSRDQFTLALDYGDAKPSTEAWFEPSSPARP